MDLSISGQNRMEILRKLREAINRGNNVGKKPEINNNIADKSTAAQEGGKTSTDHKEAIKDKMVTSKINIYHCNIRSIGNKKKSIDEIIRSNNIDICFLSELNNQCVPLFKGYHQFTRYDKRRFHGMTAIVANHLKGSVLRIPDESELEIIHLVVKTSNPVLNVIGVYLDVESRSNAEKVQSVWAQLTAKVDNILERGEAVTLIGDFNRPDNPKPSMGRKLLMEWLNDKEGPVTLVNNPSIPTRIDPGSKKGSVLDLCIVSDNIKKCVDNFVVDSKQKMTPFALIKTKGTVTKRSTDHLAIMLTLKLPMQQKKREKKRPVINYRNQQGWSKYKEISDSFAHKIQEVIEQNEDVDVMERKIQIIDTEIQIKAFGIIWQAPGKGKKTKRRENRDLNQLFKEQQEELDEMIEKGLAGKNVNERIYNMRNLITGPKIKPQEPTAINHPVTGELITDEGEIKEISLEHNVKILTKDKPRPQDEKLFKHKKRDHEKIMEQNDKDLWELDRNTFKIVSDKIKANDKNVFKMFNRAGPAYKEAIFKYMAKLIQKEEVPRDFTKTSLFQIWKKKGSALDLKNMRFVHLRCWRSKLMEALVTQKMKGDIVKATPTIQLGGMPEASSVEHLVTLKTWMKMKEQKKENGIFQVFDMQKFFDKESLLDCMSTLDKDAQVDNKSYRIWYKLNARTRISVKTSVGDSAERCLMDCLGQGSAGAALVSSLNIGCAIDKTFKYRYTSSVGSQRLNTLIFQDDISKMNDNLKQAKEGCDRIDETLKKKLLSVNYDKSKFLLIGNSRFRKSINRKLQKDPMTMGGVKIEHSGKEKYLGDIINEKGCTESIQDTIRERKRKLVSKSEEIVQLANNSLMCGLGQSKTAFNLFEAQIIPCLLNNAESWIGITNKQIKELQEFQDIFTRKVLHLAPSTTKALINWDVGMMPMKWRIASKKLQFLRKISLKDNKNIAKSILLQEVIQGISGLASECQKISTEIGLENLMLYQYSKKDIKEAIQSAMKKEFLQDMQSSVKVCDRLSDDPEDNSYIKNMSLPKVRVWIRYRARAIAGVKGNFRHSYVNNMGCRLCSEGSDETQEHLQLCEGTRFERRGLDLSDWRGLLDFWRRMKIKLAAVT